MCASCARQSLSENVSILASAANCYIGTTARGILLSIAKCDQMTAQERQRNRPLRPLDAEVWSSRSSLATSVSDCLYSPKDVVDQRKWPLVPRDVPGRPAARSTRTDDSTECTRCRAARATHRGRTNRRSSTFYQPTVHAIRECELFTQWSFANGQLDIRREPRTVQHELRSCRHEQPIGHCKRPVVRLGRGHRSPRTTHRAPWCNALGGKIHRPVRRAKAKRRERQGIGPRRTTM
jgi:hypothetical protein